MFSARGGVPYDISGFESGIEEDRFKSLIKQCGIKNRYSLNMVELKQGSNI
jgi:hypothetical protein